MARVYVVPFSGVAVSAAQDLFQIKGASGKLIRVKRVKVGATDTTLPTAQMLQFRARYLGATVTDGSGGTSVTPVPVDPGDAAASFTAKCNNTTKATTTGTINDLYETGEHIYNGVDETFDARPPIGNGESFVFELLAAPSGTIHLSGTAWVEEMGA